jgi:hypothetical protein
MRQQAIEPSMMRLTLEHVPTGVGIPEWLRESLTKQSAEGKSRIMILHANESSRKQTLVDLARGGRLDGHVVDPLDHQTISSLVELLMSDLRMPRPFPEDGLLTLLEHEEISRSASKLGFPLIHPDVERTWYISRTKRLALLHSHLLQSAALGSWDTDPGAIEFHNLLLKIEEKHGRTHPRLSKHHLSRILQGLETPPFSLANLSGIIMLNHEPTLSKEDLQLLRIISTLVPIHQMVHSGSFRLGMHGALIEDIEACRNQEDLPDWVPIHLPTTESLEQRRTHRILIDEGVDEITTVLSILDARSKSSDYNPTEKIIIVDGDANRNQSRWDEILSEGGWIVPKQVENILSSPLVHSLSRLVSIGQGDNSWAPENILVEAKNGFPISSGWFGDNTHPVNPDWQPRPHLDLLEEVAHGLHIRGGPHAMSQWLRALSEARFEHPWIPAEERRQAREETQWWLLSMANRLSPWLDEYSSSALQGDELLGCASRQILPLPSKSTNIIDWFSNLIHWTDWQQILSANPAEAGALRSLLDAVARSANILPSIGELSGIEAKDALICIMEGLSLPNPRIEDALLRVLTPSQALGCDADLLILCGTSATAWPVSSPIVPWMDLDDRLRLGVARPDAAMRSSRHLIRNALAVATEVLILDTSIIESNPPGTHWAEILDEAGKEKRQQWLSPPVFLIDEGQPITGWKWVNFSESIKGIASAPTTIEQHKNGNFNLCVNGTRIRDLRQSNGLAALQGQQTGEVVQGAAMMRWQKHLMEERNLRRPKNPEGNYLNSEEISALLSKEDLNLLNNWRIPDGVPEPRSNPTWPVIGKSHGGGRRTPSVDIRPLSPPALQVEIIDSRAGHNLAEQRSALRWSASRLHDWLDCPRKGWLKHRLKASSPDQLEDDMDGRLRGILVHDVLTLTMAEVMGFEVGEMNDLMIHPTLSSAGMSLEEVMAIALSHALSIAPWLSREDAVASHRRKSMLGLELEELRSWEDCEPSPVMLTGRLGALIRREMTISETGILSLEWDVKTHRGSRLSIEVPELKGTEGSWNFSISGRIDRIEVVPQGDGWTRKEGKKEIVPLDLDTDDEDFSLRHIIIRELKTIEGPKSGDSGKRHKRGILEEVQLALYARAWEIANPGDRVIAVGVTEVGEETNHWLEVDESVEGISEMAMDGDAKLVEALHRRRDESPDDLVSIPFRAWLRHRLEVSGRTIEAAESGAVHPTPSSSSCGFCPVTSACGLDELFSGGFL